MKVPTDRPLYGMDKPRRELSDIEKDQIRALDARVGVCCPDVYGRHIFGRCADCECKQWRPS